MQYIITDNGSNMVKAFNKSLEGSVASAISESKATGEKVLQEQSSYEDSDSEDDWEESEEE